MVKRLIKSDQLRPHDQRAFSRALRSHVRDLRRQIRRTVTHTPLRNLRPSQSEIPFASDCLLAARAKSRALGLE